uniref:Uncharacterized protein n=1 Tax=Rhizophora mucronata TaxID=61149 RepID=A0A2P2LHR0_RHIMU
MGLALYLELKYCFFGKFRNFDGHFHLGFGNFRDFYWIFYSPVSIFVPCFVSPCPLFCFFCCVIGTPC